MRKFCPTAYDEEVLDENDVQSLCALTGKLETLPAGETLVAVVGRDEGHYLFIGDTLAHHLWAVTTKELQRLKEILNNRDL